ncbi:MAG: MFS transporter [Terriglobales bacterium]|jgi:MFS family permease
MTEKNERPRDTPARGPGGIYYGWVILAACFAIITLDSGVISSFPIFYVSVMREFHWSRGITAIAMSLHLLVNGAASPLIGWIMDRFGPRLAMPVGALITAGGLFWLSRANSLWHFYAAFGILAAVGSAMLHLVPLVSIVSNWFVQRRGIAIGIVASGIGAGQLVLLPLLQSLIAFAGWRAAYLVFGVVILIVPSLLVRRFLFNRPEEVGLCVADEIGPWGKREPAVSGWATAIRKWLVPQSEVVVIDAAWAGTDWTWRKAARSFRFWALVVAMVFFATGYYLVTVQLFAYLIDRGYNPAFAASLMGLLGCFNIAGKFGGGILCDRLGRERTLSLAVALLVASLVLLHNGHFVILAVAFTLLFGVGYGMAVPSLMASATDLFQGEHFGAIFGFVILGAAVGGALGSWLGGYLFDLTRAYGMSFAVASMVMLAAASFLWKARPGTVRLVRRYAATAGGA